MRARVAAMLGAVAVAVASSVTAAPAHAAPIGAIDGGVPFSSAVYGTGCSYSLNVTVNSTGLVTVWERAPGFAPRAVGSAWADGGYAVVRWVPRRVGTRLLYATQGGVTGPTTSFPVRPGYGSGGMCFAL